MKQRGLMILAIGLFLFAQAAQADWSAVKRLTWIPGTSKSADIATDTDNFIHIVWEEFLATEGQYEIYYKKSTDGGTTWSSAKKLTSTLDYSLYPAIALDSNNHIHVVWQEYISEENNYEINYKKSTDGGATWSPAKKLTSTLGYSNDPAIAIDSNNHIHLVYSESVPNYGFALHYQKSTDGGTTWSKAKRLNLPGHSACPDMAIDSNNYVHIVWEDKKSGYREICYKRSMDGSTPWSMAKTLTATPGPSFRPAIAIDSNSYIHIVWEENEDWELPEIYYKKSTDGGITWSKAKRLTWTSYNSVSPAIAIDPNNDIHVIWERWDYGEIYYKKSTDGGTTWSTAERLTSTLGSSESPALAIDSTGYIHVVWNDYTPGDSEIYYRRGK